MIKRSVLLEKFEKMDHCLQRIEGTLQGDLERLDTPDAQEIVILNLQRLTQLTIDSAAHIIKDENLGMPDFLKDYFSVLAEKGYITIDLGKRLQKMVGFRNIAVHDYDQLNIDIVKSVCKKHLVDFRDFQKELLKGM